MKANRILIISLFLLCSILFAKQIQMELRFDCKERTIQNLQTRIDELEEKEKALKRALRNNYMKYFEDRSNGPRCSEERPCNRAVWSDGKHH